MPFRKKLLIISLFLLLNLLTHRGYSSSFQDGEKLTFDIRYGIIGAGQATLSVEEIEFRENTPAWKITSQARTNRFFDRIFKVRDEIESVMDKDLFVSHRFTKQLSEGNYRQYRIHYYYPEQNYTLYMRWDFSKNQFDEERMDIPPETHDILSAFYWLRTQDISPGDSVVVNVTADGRNYPAEVRIHRIETIKTIFGNKECLVVEPILEGDAIFKQTGEILIWLTNDVYKIPVRMQSKVIFGSFTATLSEAVNVPYK
ncbi:MAG: DUF3108 domain-containing protein [Candidatus Cloacimonetes bacterium]|nr:DUF3108 domain-containing protein [Candidatus Cloacimonadota bacterium]